MKIIEALLAAVLVTMRFLVGGGASALQRNDTKKTPVSPGHASSILL
jgi:hypothetical protein